MVKRPIIGIIQARMGSKRLPGKSILPLAGKPLLYRFIERVKQSKLLDKVVLATTRYKEDTPLCDIAKECGIDYYRGAENDLIMRIYRSAKKFRAKTIVRLCADNPLIEAEEIDRLVQSIPDKMKNMWSNTHNIKGNGYPDGLGCEVYSFFSLCRQYHNRSVNKDYREHPHKYFYNFNLVETIPCPEHLQGFSHIKLDVNTQEEYNFIKGIYDRFGHNDFHFKDYKELLCQPHGEH